MALTGNKQALVIVFALALITILYVKTEAVTPETHTWIVNHLREIEHQEALLNQEILKARSGLLPHVDSLVSGTRRVSTLIGETREVIHRMFGAGDHEIATTRINALRHHETCSRPDGMTRLRNSSNCSLRTTSSANQGPPNWRQFSTRTPDALTSTHCGCTDSWSS